MACTTCLVCMLSTVNGHRKNTLGRESDSSFYNYVVHKNAFGSYPKYYNVLIIFVMLWTCVFFILSHFWGRIFSHVWPFYEWAVSDLDRSMHRSLWVYVAHSSLIEGSHMTKNTASVLCLIFVARLECKPAEWCPVRGSIWPGIKPCLQILD
jgi:hypothetical protein